MCPYRAGRVYISACVGGNTVVYWVAVSSPTHTPSTDILHSPAYEDGTDSEF